MTKKSTVIEDRHYTKKTFEPPENFTIKITRMKEPTPPHTKSFEIDRVYLPRRKTEGTKPIFEREELRGIAHLDFMDRFDKRESKKVVDTKDNRGESEISQHIDSGEMHMTNISLSNRWKAMMAVAHEDHRIIDSTMKPKDRAKSRSHSPVDQYMNTEQYRERDTKKHKEERSAPFRHRPKSRNLSTRDLRYSLQERRDEVRGGGDRIPPKGINEEDLRHSIDIKRAKRHRDDDVPGSGRCREGQDRNISSTTSPGPSRGMRHVPAGMNVF